MERAIRLSPTQVNIPGGKQMKNLMITEELIMQQLDSKCTKEELIKKFMIASRDLALVSSQYDDLWYEHREMSCELANLQEEHYDLQAEHYDLQSEYRYTCEQALAMRAEIEYLREQLALTDEELSAKYRSAWEDLEDLEDIPF